MPRSEAANAEIRKNRKNLILKHSLDLFSKFGFKNVSSDMIAKSVGCSHGLFYHYFKDKYEILYALFEKYNKPTIIKYVIDYNKSPFKTIINYWYKILNFGSENQIKLTYLFEFQDFELDDESLIKNVSYSNTIKMMKRAIEFQSKQENIIDIDAFDICSLSIAMFDSYFKERLIKNSDKFYMPSVEVINQLFEKKNIFIV